MNHVILPRTAVTAAQSSRSCFATQPPNEVLRVDDPACLDGHTLILAPAGHGKSTLLRVMGGVPLPVGQTRAHVTVWSPPPPPGTAVYCPAIDDLLPQLTVSDTLRFAAGCLPPGGTVPASVEDRVNTVVALLKLEGVRDSVIGSDLTRGISGGQRKRVSVAQALLATPIGGGRGKVLLLDQATDGLDAHLALDMMAHILQAADAHGVIVVAALQQPRSG